MQYLLSEEEWKDIQEKLSIIRKLPDKKLLQKVCTEVSNNMLVQKGWYKGKAWGCILTVKEEWYCDDCPVKDICPHEYKEWSK